MEDENILRDKLIEFLTEKNWTMVKIAENVGVNRLALADFVNRKRKPNLKTKLLLAKFINENK
jgi:DNA-binding XRE family transcriptional regulator